VWMLGFGAFLLTGCHAPRSTARALTSINPVKKEKAADPAELEQNLFRFSDGFAVAVAASVDIMRAATNSSSDLDFQAWRLAVASDAWAVASGPNGLANVGDMIVLVTVSRRAVEEHWMTIYGTGAAPLLDCCRENETNIWHLADPYLKAGQRAELTAAIESWCKQHPGKECVSIV